MGRFSVKDFANSAIFAEKRGLGARAAIQAAAYARHARDLQLLHRRPGSVAYFGWTGYGNVGDEALFSVAEHMLDDFDVRSWPMGRFAQQLLRTRRSLLHAAILGGGTLIGTQEPRQALEAVLRHQPGVPLLMIGPGVEDPEHAAAGSGAAIRDELQRWIPLLARFERVTVRGPRSQKLLADHGLTSAVVGDPALLLEAAHVSAAEPDGRVLGLNLMTAGRAYSDNLDRVAETLVESVQDLIARGWHIRLFPFWGPDSAVHENVKQRLGSAVDLVPATSTLDTLLTNMASCRMIVGTKLHSVVLSAAAGVPAISVAYAPKCFDFQASVDQEDLTIRTDQMTRHALLTMVERVDSDISQRAERVRSRVATLRLALRAEFAAIAACLETVTPHGTVTSHSEPPGTPRAEPFLGEQLGFGTEMAVNNRLLYGAGRLLAPRTPSGICDRAMSTLALLSGGCRSEHRSRSRRCQRTGGPRRPLGRASRARGRARTRSGDRGDHAAYVVRRVTTRLICSTTATNHRPTSTAHWNKGSASASTRRVSNSPRPAFPTSRGSPASTTRSSAMPAWSMSATSADCSGGYANSSRGGAAGTPD